MAYIENKWTKVSDDSFVMANGTTATRVEMQSYLDALLNSKDTNDAAYQSAQSLYDQYIADWTTLLS
tara:strand:- start:583 stop:783 length:201 start_codon:yes stop_codon:yes gene_type:complete